MTDVPTRIHYENPSPAVARIVLAKPETRNAQDSTMLYEIDAAFQRAAADDHIKVVILAAEGPHFSSGHDLRNPWHIGAQAPVSMWGGFDQPGCEGLLAAEEEIFLGLCWRWRNFPKPTIAEVQGRAIAGVLMLVWSCDLIVATTDARFSDPVVALGVNGHEFFVHAWELGARRAKEMLFTGGDVSAEEARQLGMVNHVVELDELPGFTLALAERIARMPSLGLKLAKQSVNQSLDAQGQWTAVQAAFSLHQIGHAHNMKLFGQLIDPSGPETIRELTRTPARGR
jgi:enoyl-CoA hydratase